MQARSHGAVSAAISTSPSITKAAADGSVIAIIGAGFSGTALAIHLLRLPYPESENIAAFYEAKQSRAKRWRDVDLSQKWPSGGLIATSSDLARLCGGWFDARYLSPATVAKFWEQQRLNSGEVNEQGYAIGWRAQPHPTPRYHHGGISKGAMSWLVCYPEARLGIALNIISRLERFNDLADVEPPITRLFFEVARARLSP